MPNPDIDGDFLRRLGVKPGERVSLIAAPREWVGAMRGLLNGSVASARSPSTARKANVQLVWLSPKDDLRSAFDSLEDRIPPDGAIWTVIPKKSALAKGEAAVEWRAMQAAGLASGRLVDNKELRFDDRYYGTRFVVRKDQR
jgi:hypothetical protein